MIDIEEAFYLGYKSVCVAHSAAHYKRSLCKDQRAHFKKAATKFNVGSPERIELERKRELWDNLFVGYHWQTRFFDQGNAGPGSGARVALERVWTEILGNSLSGMNGLPNFEAYKALQVKSPLTFTEKPPAEIEALELQYQHEEFDDDADWEEQYITLLDALTNDMWREEGMRVWLNNNLDRSTGNESSLMWWDLIMHHSGDFFSTSNVTCLTNLDVAMHKYEEPDFEDTQEIRSQISDKYEYRNHDDLVGAGGLYAINYDKLPTEWKEKVEIVPVHYLS